jgi:hypothetical protein
MSVIVNKTKAVQKPREEKKSEGKKSEDKSKK